MPELKPQQITMHSLRFFWSFMGLTIHFLSISRRIIINKVQTAIGIFPTAVRFNLLSKVQSHMQVMMPTNQVDELFWQLYPEKLSKVNEPRSHEW